jgi:hypothetical protein
LHPSLLASNSVLLRVPFLSTFSDSVIGIPFLSLETELLSLALLEEVAANWKVSQLDILLVDLQRETTLSLCHQRCHFDSEDGLRRDCWEGVVEG